jgi:hypothetical protein
MKNTRVLPNTMKSSRQQCWVGAGLATSVLLAGCMENEDLIADTVVTIETTFGTEAGDANTEGDPGLDPTANGPKEGNITCCHCATSGYPPDHEPGDIYTPTPPTKIK